MSPVWMDGQAFSLTGGPSDLVDLAADKERPQVGPRYACPEDVFDESYTRLVSALTVLAGDRSAAEDAVQEAFVRLLEKWSRVSSYEDPAGWVRRVALNRIRDQRRSLGRLPEMLLRLGEREPERESWSEEDRLWWQKLASLPHKQRTAVALHYLADLTVAEVAYAMRVSEGAVSQHLHRGRETLRELLKDTL